MYRYRLVFSVILVTLLVSTGCRIFRGESRSDITQAKSSAAAKPADETESPYTLRLVFDGLTTLWEPDASEHPGEAWVLLANAKHPDQLEVGRGVGPHEADLLVKRGVQTSGRTLNPLTETMLENRHPRLELSDNWQRMVLSDEELVLSATTRTPLTIVRNKGQLPEPCEPKESGCAAVAPKEEQKKDILWTVDLNDVLGKLPQGTPADKRLKTCLLTPTYSCKGDPLLLATRLHLTHGTVHEGNLETDGTDRLTHQVFPTVPTYLERALASEIVVDLEVRGDVELGSKPLRKSDRPKPTLVIHGRPNEVVEVRIGNHPIHGMTEAMNRNLLTNDFLITYNLLENPRFTPPARLPALDTRNPGAGFNGQCSPNNVTGTGGI
ncbi:MAG: hypothetical protein ACJ76N_10750 [Thermoanaerobaculia bacterium]